MSTAFITHSDCLLHDLGAGHPESPARLQAINDQLLASGLGNCLLHLDAPLASREHHRLARVAIVDFDVHHGNGTENIFCDDERVLMVSTFQHPFYPYSGTAGRSERMVNIPLAAGSGGREFREAVVTRWLPALDRFKPEMVFVSAGFDAHRDDDMAMLQLADADYAWVTQQVRAVADRDAHGRIVSLLEGGYELHALDRLRGCPLEGAERALRPKPREALPNQPSRIAVATLRPSAAKML